MTTLDPATPSLDVRGRRRLALVALCLTGFLIQLDVTIVNVALPTIQHELAAVSGELEWIISGYALSLAALLPLMGALGDRLGHRPVLLAGLVVFGVCSAGAALASSPALLVAARIGQGVGGAAMMVLTLAVLTDIYPPAQRGQAFGWWAAIAGTGFGAGPIVGGALLTYAGWPTIFWINLPVVAVTVVSIGVAVQRSPTAATRRPLDVRGLVAASAGLASVTLGLIAATDTPWHPVRTLAPIGLGGLCLAAFVQRQRHAPHPLVPPAVRTNRDFVGASLVYFASYMAFSGTLYYVTLLFQNLKGWSPLHTGLSWLLMNVPFLATAQLAGRLHRRFSLPTIVTAGCVAAAAGVAALSTLSHARWFVVAAVGYLIAGIGFGLLVPGITHIAMRDVRGDITGSASAMLNSSRQLGTGVGLAVIGAIGAAATHRTWLRTQSAHPGADTTDVVSGQLRSLSPNLRGAATRAFEDGYHAALVACLVGLVVAIGLSLLAFRTRPDAPGEPAPNDADSRYD